jgi:hypothetical protein
MTIHSSEDEDENEDEDDGDKTFKNPSKADSSLWAALENPLQVIDSQGQDDTHPLPGSR